MSTQQTRQSRLEQAEHNAGLLIINAGFAGYFINFALFGYYCYVTDLHVILIVNTVVTACFGLAKLFRKRIAGRERQIAVTLTMIAVLSGIPSFHSVRDNPEISIRAATMITMALLGIVVIASCPDFRRRFYPLVALVTGACLTVSALNSEQTQVNLAVAIGSALIGYLLKRLIDVQMARHIELVETREELILVKAEEQSRLELASYQREMELARKVQNSIKAPPEIQLSDDVVIRTYQIPCNDVAGDWLAVRRTATDTIALVADASGKGIQASLVIHAIQSLWAASLDDETFDAENWIRQANRILFNLGQSEMHIVTLGLIVIRDHEIIYYGCGHPPLVSLISPDGSKGESGEPVVRYHMGKGDILGLKKELWLQAVTIPIPRTGELDILLGTDGIIDGKLLRKKTLVAEFIGQLGSEGEKAIIEYDAFDDKTLIWLHRTAQTRRDTKAS